MAAAPYPADTRAKGWRFELDHERIRQSDTWALATPDCRPWLLMLWMVAWEQAPCGSLPNDDELIAARIGMQPKTFAKHRAVLMRGWCLADDGRLYHGTMTERVLEMIERRTKEAKRRAEYRARMKNVDTTEQHADDRAVTPEPASVPPASRSSPAVVTRDTRGTDDTGTGTSINTPHTPRRGASPVSLKAWLEAVKAKGEKAIPEDDAVFAYAADVGIPEDFLHLCWREFRARYSDPGAKRYRDWRSVFRKAVRGNWLKLWWLDGERYSLTTTGQQAMRAHRERAAA